MEKLPESVDLNSIREKVREKLLKLASQTQQKRPVNSITQEDLERVREMYRVYARQLNDPTILLAVQAYLRAIGENIQETEMDNREVRPPIYGSTISSRAYTYSEHQPSSLFLDYIKTKRRNPPRTTTQVGSLWIHYNSIGLSTYGIERVSQLLNSPEGGNLNAAQLVNLALMAEVSECFEFALGLWANAYQLENDIDIDVYALAITTHREYSTQFQEEVGHARGLPAQYSLAKARQQIQAAITRREEFRSYLMRVRSAAQITSDIYLCWESRIVSSNWYQDGAEGAQLYLARYGYEENIKSPKLYGLAAISEEMGYPALAYGFWAAAYKLDTGEEAPLFVDITSQPAVGSANFRQLYPESVPPIRRFSQSMTSLPAPPPTDNPPELEDGGYWDERFKGVDI
jgi:hypothetical protein